MADLGTLTCRVLQGKRCDLPLSSLAAGRPSGRAAHKTAWYMWVPQWTDNGFPLSATANGTISGAVTDSGTPVPYCVVRLYYRKTGYYIRQTRTDSSGNFSFGGLNPSETQAYFAIAFDPEGGVQYNAIIFDRLTAV